AAIRMRKEPGEILAMERATAIATASLLSTLASGVRGKTERDVAADLAREMVRRGAEGVSFPPIVADGPRSAMPHATPAGAVITGDGPLVLDFGARWNGYCSDETVTILPPRPRSPLGKAFDAVRRAQAAGISSVRPGEPCRAVDARVRDSLDRSGYLKYFVHSTGHGGHGGARRLSPRYRGDPARGHGEGNRIGVRTDHVPAQDAHTTGLRRRAKGCTQRRISATG
ncbi:MAG: hypothetical protein B7Z62_09280, partial [Deltaproteobacteria bacterium 37-65-8]